MKYDLIVSDFDGTLGVAPDIIEPETVDAIKKFIGKGGKFAVCTGRPYQSIKKILSSYGLYGLVGCLQGAEVVDMDTDKVIFSGGISGKYSEKIVRELVKDSLSPCIFANGKLYYSSESKYSTVYKNMGVIEMVKVDDIIKTVSEIDSVYKIASTLGEEKIPEFVRKYNALFGEVALFNSGAKEVFENVEKNANKGTTVKVIANYYNIPLNKVLAVGDSTNDIELVSGEWHGVAVGDGADELKKSADEVTVSFKDQPIKYLIEKYCL